jgi:hypothetical protein
MSLSENFLGSFIGAVFSFFSALLLLIMSEKRKQSIIKKKKKKKFLDLFDSFSKMYDVNEYAELFRITKYLSEEIEDKLKMTCKYYYNEEEIHDNSEDSNVIGVFVSQNPTKGSILLYDNRYYVKITQNWDERKFFERDLVNAYQNPVSGKKGYTGINFTIFVHFEDIVLRRPYFGKDKRLNPELLIDFLKHLEKKYTKEGIIKENEILVSKSLINTIKKQEYPIEEKDT